jgi:uncharacterized protein (DUF2235 family)
LRARIWTRPSSDFGPRRGQVIHVIILDGTMSSLDPGCETNAGIAYNLCREMGHQLSIYYEPGLQWTDWRSAIDVLLGRGINRQIRRAYGYLASRYHPGDQIFLMGYSRGAYAVRSLAGVIDLVGLLRAEYATERNIREVYRHYEAAPGSQTARVFAKAFCYSSLSIEAIGVWDTVKSLGLTVPLLRNFSQKHHAFHNHQLSHIVQNGFHALAADETRAAFAPVLWESLEGWEGHIEQMWFPGSHGDVGGQLGGFADARPLANIPLVWLLEQMQGRGLPLPEGWQRRFELDPAAPSVGTFRGYGKWFVTRKARMIGLDKSERKHPSIAQRAAGAGPAPRPRMRGYLE